MATVIGFASGKGGTGKTTLTAKIGQALAALGNKVLLIDGAIGQRTLDIALNMQDELLYHFGDVLDGTVDWQDAVYSVEGVKDLYFLSAPQVTAGGSPDEAQWRKLLDQVSNGFDFVLVDCPAGAGRWVCTLLACCNRTILTVTPDLMSARCAERLVSLLEPCNCEFSMTINRVRVDRIQKNDMMDIDGILNVVAVPLIGAVPEEEAVETATCKGQLLALSSKVHGAKAYENIARRILGQKVPILQDESKGPFKKWRRNK